MRTLARFALFAVCTLFVVGFAYGRNYGWAAFAAAAAFGSLVD